MEADSSRHSLPLANECRDYKRTARYAAEMTYFANCPQKIKFFTRICEFYNKLLKKELFICNKT